MKNEKLPVLLIHGFTTTKLANLPVHNALRKAGFHTYNVTLPGLNTQDIRQSSPLVAERVQEILEKHAIRKLLLVGISMGGLIGLHYLRKHQGHKHVHKFVSLGAPFQGAPVADILRHLPNINETAAVQMAPGSNLLEEITQGEFEHVSITSLGIKGDTLVPDPLHELAGARNIVSPNGIWPMGHYDLVLRKANHQLLITELEND